MNLHSQIMSMRLQFDAELEEAKTAAYSEGRKDEREASCVDELVAALKRLQSAYMNSASPQDRASCWDQARAVLAKLEQS